MGNFTAHYDPNAGHEWTQRGYTAPTEEERAALEERARKIIEESAADFVAKKERARIVYEEAIASSLKVAENATKQGFATSAERALKRAEMLKEVLAAGKQWLEKGKPAH